MIGARPGEHEMLELMVAEVRGPRRNAIFAGWLCLRVCTDIAESIATSDRNTRRRLTALRKRIATLTLPAALRRTIQDIIEDLMESGRAVAIAALEQLRDGLQSAVGDEAAAAVTAALEPVRTAVEAKST